jgi:hypothetical protein
MPSHVTSQLSQIGHDKHLAALDGVTIAVACLPLIIRTGITVPISPRVRDFLPKGKKALGLLRRLGADGTLAGHLSEAYDSLRLLSRHIRVRVVVERPSCSGLQGKSRRTPSAGQPTGSGCRRLFPDNSSAAAGDEVRTQPGSTSVGEPPTTVRTAVTQPSSGDGAKEIVRATSAIRKRLQTALGCAGGTEATVFLQQLDAFNSETI